MSVSNMNPSSYYEPEELVPLTLGAEMSFMDVARPSMTAGGAIALRLSFVRRCGEGSLRSPSSSESWMILPPIVPHNPQTMVVRCFLQING